MKLLIIYGPHAVGKMTVGQELAKLTGLKLFHNHMTIDIVADLFRTMPKERIRLTELFRREIFEAFSKSEEYGMIFTYMWAFDSPSDWEYIEWLEKLFVSRGAEVYYLELEADPDVRLERNKTENRLLHKPSKRDIKHSEELFQTLESKYRLNSFDGEFSPQHYIRIKNTNLEPEKVAKRVVEEFQI